MYNDPLDLYINNDKKLTMMNKIIKYIWNKRYELLNNDREKYIKFYNSYSKFIKIGLYNDSRRKDKLIDLLLFKHINNTEEYISLK